MKNNFLVLIMLLFFLLQTEIIFSLNLYASEAAQTAEKVLKTTNTPLQADCQEPQTADSKFDFNKSFCDSLIFRLAWNEIITDPYAKKDRPFWGALINFIGEENKISGSSLSWDSIQNFMDRELELGKEKKIAGIVKFKNQDTNFHKSFDANFAKLEQGLKLNNVQIAIDAINLLENSFENFKKASLNKATSDGHFSKKDVPLKNLKTVLNKFRDKLQFFNKQTNTKEGANQFREKIYKLFLKSRTRSEDPSKTVTLTNSDWDLFRKGLEKDNDISKCLLLFTGDGGNVTEKMIINLSKRFNSLKGESQGVLTKVDDSKNLSLLQGMAEIFSTSELPSSEFRENLKALKDFIRSNTSDNDGVKDNFIEIGLMNVVNAFMIKIIGDKKFPGISDMTATGFLQRIQEFVFAALPYMDSGLNVQKFNEDKIWKTMQPKFKFNDEDKEKVIKSIREINNFFLKISSTD